MNERLELHCRCGVSFAAPVHASVRDQVVKHFQVIHTGPGHGEATALAAAIERAHNDALFEALVREYAAEDARTP